MRKLLLLVLACVLSACSTTPQPTTKTMKAFTSEAELKSYFQELAKKRQNAQGGGGGEGSLDSYLSADPSEGFTFALPDSAESVTNTQHEGVDEGGIVKVHGNHLVILRRGRLFTVAIDDNRLTPVSTVDAFAPGMDPTNTWYDEMLIAGDTVVVIGYSYQRGGTEIGTFSVDAAGRLSYQATHHLRSDDYYSSRNYASRLVGSKLIFYSPLRVGDLNEPFSSFPAVRKWHENATDSEFQRTAQPTSVYRPEGEFVVNYRTSLHTVTVCDLANGGFDCKATVVIGPSGRVFYVSPDSVYVWATPYDNEGKRQPSLLFRMPLDGSGPSALRASGSPVDQFSFLQSDDQHLNVLVRSEGKGDGMWAAEVAEGEIALMRVPLTTFSDGSETVPAGSYKSLSKPEGYSFRNRFVGDYLIYGTGAGWGPEEKLKERKELFLIDYAKGDSYHFNLAHGVDRIERMDNGAVVVGTEKEDLYFTSVRLAPQPEIASSYKRKNAAEGDLRSHGFFYKPDGYESGTLGLPISTRDRVIDRHVFETPPAILFLRNAGLQLSEAGELEAHITKELDDRCRASCVDWYGNSRPLFLRGRVFALLGYELVEGKLDNGRINELRRINYAPL